MGQIALASLFGWLFHLVGIPAAWLSGAVIGAIVWGLTGSRARLPRALVDTAMVLAGVVMGAGITPEALAAIAAYPASIVLLILAIVVVTFFCAQFLMRVYGWRRDDAILASLPGALTAVLAVSVSRNADVTRIAVVQSFRLLILIAVLPFLVSFLGDGDSRALVGAGQIVAGPGAFAVMVAAALATALLFERLQIAAPFLLGAFSASALLHVTEITPGVVPPTIATAAFVIIGIFIGERFTTLDRTLFRELLGAATGVFAIGLVLSAAIALLVSWLTGVEAGATLVAFAPGGLEAMIVLAVVLGVDPLYVGVHHTIRFLGIGFALPFLFPQPRRSNQGGGDGSQ
jgi:membrane AbrB-like protein